MRIEENERAIRILNTEPVENGALATKIDTD